MNSFLSKTFHWLIPMLVTATGLFCKVNPNSGKLIDLTDAVIVTKAQLTQTENKAVFLLLAEIQKRTGLSLKHVEKWPHTKVSVLFIGLAKNIPKTKASVSIDLLSNDQVNKPEGYQLWVDQKLRLAPTIMAIGNDSRGFLYAIGRLLRSLNYEKQRLLINKNLRVITAPRYPIRGMQLEYRSLPNTYDKWDLSQFEQYIKDLIVFGANAIEIHPGFPDDPNRNEFMKTEPAKMMRDLSIMADDYGLDVWMWYPALDGDYDDPQIRKNALEERREIFKKCKRLDALFVPGGDPGHTHPRILMPFLAEVVEILKQYHPNAGLWVSPQGFNQALLNFFYQYLQNKQPDWLQGVVYGPWVHTSLPKLRAAVPGKYLIRRYPDITHCVRCQYPVPNWDLAFARTLGREPINPLPYRQAQIHNALDEYAQGSIAYSEGVNDDLNKFIWLALDWNPDQNIVEILRQYARYFMPDGDTEGIAQGLLNLEKNWNRPLISHQQVNQTLLQWQSMEKNGSPELLNNWRFQMCLFRAYYDALVRRRLIHETELEQRVYEKFYQASEIRALKALDSGLNILRQPDSIKIADDLRKRIEQLGAQLFNNIGMQMSVKKYGADGPERGAVLDFLDVPLNNREWLEFEINRIRKLPDEKSRLSEIEEILNWENPGPGGFYDNLGNATQQPHLLPGVGLNDDPGFVESSHVEFSWKDSARLSWQCQAQTLYTTPLRMRYENLAPDANYRIRVLYNGRFRATLKLLANERFIIHSALKAVRPPKPVEFMIPHAATAGGKLELAWYCIEGRGCQVAEVWLLRE